MNNSLIKFLGIFLIFLFCFSPLGAIDLGQGDNSTQINDFNNTAIEDLNDTVIADDSSHDENDMEIKSDNETDDKKAIDYDVEIQNVSGNDSNSSKNLQAHDPKLSMECEDSFYGESAIVKIYFKDKGFGYSYNNLIRIGGCDNDIREVQTEKSFSKGCNIVKLRNNLPPGTYYISYTFYSDSGWYNNVYVDGYLTVHKRDPAIECSINDIDYGEKPVLNFNSEECLGEAKLYVDSLNFTHDYTFHIPKNQKEPLTFQLEEDLTPGVYTCTLQYSGDSTHVSQISTVSFRVNKLNPNLTVDANDVTHGDNLSVEIHANKLFNGDVTFKLGNDFQKVHLAKGVGYATIDSHKLSPGKYPISVYVDETGYFYKGLTFSSFTVLENPNLNVKVNNISFFDKLKVEVSTNNTINGIVQVKLNNSDGVYDIPDDVYDVEVKDGAGSVEITTYMPPGNYTASAYYAGDDVFGESKAITKFAVNYHVPDIRINVNNINVGDTAKVEVSASSNLTDFTDYVQVQLNNSDKVYDVLVRNGYGKVEISGLAPGNYTASAYFKGDGVFEPKNVSTSFSVLQLDPDLKISVSNITIGNTAKVDVSANKNLTGNVRVQLNNSDKVYDVDVKDGAGSVLISSLTPGNYTASAYYAGDNFFREAKAITKFALDTRSLT